MLFFSFFLKKCISSTKVKVLLLYLWLYILHDTIPHWQLRYIFFSGEIFFYQDNFSGCLWNTIRPREVVVFFCVCCDPKDHGNKRARKTNTKSYKTNQMRETNVTSTSFRWKNRREPRCSNYARHGRTYFRLKNFTPWTYESNRSIRHGPSPRRCLQAST